MSGIAPILSMTGIDKRFPGVHALRDLSLHLRAGEVFALVGENGAGRSTLIKLLGGAQSARLRLDCDRRKAGADRVANRGAGGRDFDYETSVEDETRAA